MKQHWNLATVPAAAACLAILTAAACSRRAADQPAPSGASSSGAAGTASSPGAAPADPSPIGGGPPAATGPVTPKTQAPNEARVLSSAFAAVARALRPSVVRIDVEIQHPALSQRDPGDDSGDGEQEVPPLFRRFFGFGNGRQAPEPGPQRGTGSGVVLDTAGDIVTNRHVVSGATTTKVTFSDGREFSARTVGMDAETDVAVIRLDKPPQDLVAARLGDSDKLDVGEWVLAVGSPLGLDQTVTAGIVSGLGRVGRHVQMSGGRVRRYIQTDAKINPGNSGGPLVNLSAEVVGINTLINTGPGGAYGFAIPINQVQRVAQSLSQHGRVRYPYLGVLVGDLKDVDPERRAKLPAGLPDNAAFVSEATPGGPSDKAGLRAGDVITDIDGHKMEGAGDVIDYVGAQSLGKRVAVGYLRDGRRATAEVTLGELPSGEAQASPEAPKLGLALQTLSPQLAQSLGLDPHTRGAVITEVAAASPAARAGLAEGDIILEVDRKPILTAGEATATLAVPRKSGHLLRVRGPAGVRFVTIAGE
jgi:serine protease Do